MNKTNGQNSMKKLVIIFGFLNLLFIGIIQGNDLKTGLSASDMRCEYKVTPVTDVKNPRLSWILNSDERGQYQTAYQIIVASSPEKLKADKADLWNSQKVKSDKTYQIVYKGKPLNSREICYWKVRSWDKNGKPGQWSSISHWEMGLLNKNEWKANWIGLDLNNLGKGKIYHLPPAPYLRKEIKLNGSIKKARLYVTALGLYEFYINGNKIGNDYLTPGWTDYNKRVYYQTYDVTKNLHKGENAIGSILSYGWYSGYLGYALLVNNPKVRAFYGKVPKLMAQLEVEYDNGTKAVFATNASWKADFGPIVQSDILEGELYDARKEFNNWANIGFNDSNWKKIKTYPETNRKIQCYPGNPIQITQIINPVSISARDSGMYIFDMGQNFAGVVTLKVKGNAGDTVVIRYGEMLYPDGRLMTDNLRMARATDTYILKGNPEGEIWTPDFTYHGFQYVEVSGLKFKPDLNTITGLVLGSTTPSVGSFACSDTLVNKLYSNIVWTQRSNFMDIPTDCPQRDERLGWTADAQIYISSAVCNRDVAAFFTKWIADLNDAQLPNGAYPVFAPFPHLRSSDSYSPGWMEAVIIIPYQIYKTYDDTRLIKKYWPNMVKFMNFLQKKSKGKYYIAEGSYNDIEPKGGYGDWLSIGKKTSPDMLATMYYGYCASMMSEMANAANKTEQAKYFADLFNKIKMAFLQHYAALDGRLKCNTNAYGSGEGYVDGQLGFSGNTQTAYDNAIYMHMLPDSLVAKAGEYLNQLVLDNKGYLTTGFLGVKALLPALSMTGHNSTAYRLLLNKNYPSWEYEVENGATTIWERWNSYTKGQGFMAGMNSFNHYSFGSVCEWMFKYMAGISSEGPAYKNIIIKPEISNGKITNAQASLITMNGKIISSWKVEGNKLLMNVTIPVNTSSVIYIPAKAEDSVKEDGIEINKVEEIKVDRFVNGYLKLNAGSGEFNFESVIN